MAALWLVNTEEVERHQGKNPRRWCGAAPDPRCGAPPWIEWRAIVGRMSRRPHDVTVLPCWSVLVDLLARESVEVEAVEGGEAVGFILGARLRAGIARG
jgi:hypothetical protein